MKKIIINLLVFVLFSINSINAQQWKALDRQQKDSVVFNQRNKGNKYLGIGAGGGFLSGGWDGIFWKIEPVFGKFLFNRQLFAANFIYEKANLSVETESKESELYSFGGFYRYYLPERKTLSMFFGQVGLNVGKFSGTYNLNGIENNAELTVLTLSVSGGISFPINKFNLELIVNYNYELLNQDALDEFFVGKTLGMLNFSYSF